MEYLHQLFRLFLVVYILMMVCNTGYNKDTKEKDKTHSGPNNQPQDTKQKSPHDT